jgi:hypothetical protein
MLQAYPDPFNEFGQASDDQKLFSILPPLSSIMSPAQAFARSSLSNPRSTPAVPTGADSAPKDTQPPNSDSERQEGSSDNKSGSPPQEITTAAAGSDERGDEGDRTPTKPNGLVEASARPSSSASSSNSSPASVSPTRRLSDGNSPPSSAVARRKPSTIGEEADEEGEGTNEEVEEAPSSRPPPEPRETDWTEAVESGGTGNDDSVVNAWDAHGGDNSHDWSFSSELRPSTDGR